MFTQEITVRNLQQFQSLQTEMYIMAAIVALVFVGVSLASALLINWAPDQKDTVKRRVIFYSLGLLAASTVFGYNKLFLSQTVLLSLAGRFASANIISVAIVLGVYFLTGLVLSKVMKNSKYGTIFPSRVR